MAMFLFAWYKYVLPIGVNDSNSTEMSDIGSPLV